ncbi:MAG: alkaline phosphatase family protein [Anaerolineae bacterium]
MRKVRRVVLALAIWLVVVGCSSSWEVTLVEPDGATAAVSRDDLRALELFADDEGSVPLERVLYGYGYRLVETLQVTDVEGADHAFVWPQVAKDALWRTDGVVELGGEELRPARIAGQVPAALETVTAGLTDVAPTAAAALGLTAPSEATGRVLMDPPDVDHVVLLFLDGFGYVRYQEARDAGLIPNLAALGEPVVGLAAYPPSTVVSSAAILTGAPPEANGVVERRARKTEIETLFDVAAEAGLRVVAVEGNALSFNLRNADTTLSGDHDGNGSTDDNALANALEVLQGPMPDLFWIHFHGIDDAGHTYGPGAPEEEAAVAGVDAAVGELLAAFPPRTWVLIFADHGMHAVEEGERLGNHAHLIERDMLVPIWTTNPTEN